MNLAQKIINMNEHCDQGEIAESLQIPKEIVQGIIDGTIDGDSLDAFDPSRPYELRLVKEDGLKVIEQKLEEIESRKSKNKARQMLSKIWGGMLDAIWIVALVVCVSCAIYGFYLVGQTSGFENEVLTKVALLFEGVFNRIVGIIT